MTVKRVRVRINHRFEVDIPDHLLADGQEDLLDEYLYDYFIDEDWIFDDVDIYD